MLRLLSFCLALLATASCKTISASERTTSVMVISSIHSAHRDHPSYSYEDLFAVIRAFDPDVVAVEIRAEDLQREPEYLQRNYPFEMRELAKNYGAKVVGVDWLGSELQGRAVPDNWWKEKSWVKRLESERTKDPEYSTTKLDMLRRKQLELIESATPSSLNDGRYEELTRDYYREFGKLVEGTRYERLAHFYRERDRRISANVARLVEASPGKRIVVVLGADHRASVVDELRRRFGSAIILVPVQVRLN